MTARIPATVSPSRSTTRRRTPCVDGWFGPKLTRRMSSRRCFSGIDLEDRRHGLRDARSLVDARRRKDRHQSSSEKRTGSPPERIVLAERMSLPVLGHEDADEVRVALEADPHHVEGLALEPVGGRPDGEDARDRLAVVEPHLDTQRAPVRRHAQQVVRDREALRLRQRDPREPLRAGHVNVAPRRRADVAGDLLLAPAEVVGRGDVGEEVEAVLVAQRRAGLDETCGIDDERRLAERLARLDDAGHDAYALTPRLRGSRTRAGRRRGSSRGAGRCPPSAPPGAAGSRARGCRPGRSCRRPGGSCSC